ncbi:hypothetical protein CAEBREN_14196 [Caenorhabditis brenneri]|uniref:Uncharacterized protein n=1 Tax=Caenorhabditis brenneri TaxID=135651 RepID=G0NI10_CAEBE|nr:hypothetical protein CAEBREN_14196 [Caenorhabditis brenneri]
MMRVRQKKTIGKVELSGLASWKILVVLWKKVRTLAEEMTMEEVFEWQLMISMPSVIESCWNSIPDLKFDEFATPLAAIRSQFLLESFHCCICNWRLSLHLDTTNTEWHT